MPDFIIGKWTSGVLRRRSPSSINYPDDAWQDARNVIPVGDEIRRRNGSSPFCRSAVGLTTLHSECTYDSKDGDYILQHWDDKLYALEYDETPRLLGTVVDANSQMFQIGKHILLGIDSEDGNGHPYNYIISWSSVTRNFTLRRCGLPSFDGGTYLDDITLTEINIGAGNMEAGTYKYMFTFAVYDGSTMISEGGGFNEIQYVKEITLTDTSDVRITFDTSLLSGVLPDWITHINVFRSLRVDGDWNSDEVYNDDYKATPIYPWFRFVDKVAPSASQYTHDDTNSDDDLKKVLDTYDSRGWVPLPRMKFGLCAPNGRIFVMNSTFPGRVHFTENALSPNRDVTKYYEHYAEGFNYFIDVGLDAEQEDTGLILSPIGDLLIGQDSRIFRIHQADPLRSTYLGELKGFPAEVVNNRHGILNVKACTIGKDNKLYVFGNGGYRSFNGVNFDDRDFMETINLPHLEDSTNYLKMRAIYYPGSLHTGPDGKNGIDQIILSYPSVDGGEIDECLVVAFTNEGITTTLYDGFGMIGASITPTTKKLVITDNTDGGSYHQDDSSSNVDRLGATDEARIGWYFTTKDFSMKENQEYAMNLDSIIISGNNLDKEVEIQTAFDSLPRLNRRIITPNIDNISILSYKPRVVKRYEKEFDDEAFGNTFNLTLVGRGLEAPTIESIKPVYNQGERLI